jgi:hypothetical protein
MIDQLKELIQHNRDRAKELKKMSRNAEYSVDKARLNGKAEAYRYAADEIERIIKDWEGTP